MDAVFNREIRVVRAEGGAGFERVCEIVVASANALYEPSLSATLGDEIAHYQRRSHSLVYGLCQVAATSLT